MDQPAIRFTTTADDVTIAWWSIGEGPPLILTHNFSLSHAELEWSVPAFAAFYRKLAERHRLIRFDPRHSGMSEFGSDLDLTLAGMGNDLTAVADAAGADEFALLAIATMGPVAIEYAATHPDRVSHLILCDTYAKPADSPHASWIQAQAALSRHSEGAGLSASLLRAAIPPAEVEEVVALAAAAGGQDQDETTSAILEWDAVPRLDAVRAPTMILFGRESRVSELDEARRLVTTIPTAQLKTVGGSFLPYYADQAESLAAIAEFVGTPDPTPRPMSGFTTVVFSDLVASTEMMSRLGDADGRAVLREVEAATMELASKHNGEVIKFTGDGSMTAFSLTTDALAFAVAVVEAMTDSPLDLRIGMAAGEPIRENGDLYGVIVHQSSRIADQAGAGEIVVADAVRQLALGKGFVFEPAGETALKGFDEPVRLWKVSGAS